MSKIGGSQNGGIATSYAGFATGAVKIAATHHVIQRLQATSDFFQQRGRHHADDDHAFGITIIAILNKTGLSRFYLLSNKLDGVRLW